MLPWAMAHLEEARGNSARTSGPYGFERNRDTARDLPALHFEQGLSKTTAAAEQLFAPETLESFKI